MHLCSPSFIFTWVRLHSNTVGTATVDQKQIVYFVLIVFRQERNPLTKRRADCVKKKYAGISIFRTSQGNENWLEKSESSRNRRGGGG